MALSSAQLCSSMSSLRSVTPSSPSLIPTTTLSRGSHPRTSFKVSAHSSLGGEIRASSRFQFGAHPVAPRSPLRHHHRCVTLAQCQREEGSEAEAEAETDAAQQQQHWGAAAAGAESSKSPQPMGVQQVSQNQPYGVPEKGVEPEQWDVVGLGQAMVDFSAMVSDEFLESLNLPRGQRVVVDHEERGQVLGALDGCAYKLSAGGSLSNTLVALARLGSVGGKPASGCLGKQEQEAGVEPSSLFATSPSDECLPILMQQQQQQQQEEEEDDSKQVHVAMVGSVGSDALGDFYRTKLLRANVHFLSPPIEGGTTGTVIVLTTPDAQRTMLSYQGMSSHVSWDSHMEAVVAKSRVLVVEGYLWELPQTVDAIAEACAIARSKGLLVALTASDASCVLRHRPKFWSVLCRSAHMLFTNANEARALAGFPESTSTAALAEHLSQFCPLVAVTDGEAGSYLGLRGQVVHIPAHLCVPKDTCGAGDAYAAGVLYALLKGAPDLASIGDLAARVSAVVVSQQGARLREEDAEGLVQSLGFSQRSLVEGQVFHRMTGLQPVQEAASQIKAIQ